MKNTLVNPTYFNGFGVEKLAAKIQENAKATNSIVIKPELPADFKHQLRYPNSFEK